MSLLTTIQEKCGYPALQKIDPNTQEKKIDSTVPAEDRFSQAAIPAIIIGLYKFSQTDKGADMLLTTHHADNWISEIFGADTTLLVEKISTYAGYQTTNTLTALNKIALTIIETIKDQLTIDTSLPIVEILSSLRAEALHYLPASLQIGVMVQENTTDDRTNKMEGPVSGLVQSIGNIFSTSEKQKDI